MHLKILKVRHMMYTEVTPVRQNDLGKEAIVHLKYGD